jgi:hypothetical protein
MLLRLGAGGILGIVFSAIGLASLAVAGALAWDLHVDRAERAHVAATIVANDRRCNKGCSYRPVAEYEVAGQRYRVSGVVGNATPVFQVGETVTVLVPAEDPADARIDHWTESGFGILFGLGFFAIFGGIGLPLLVQWLRQRAGERWARESGIRVDAEFVGVERDARIRVNGRSPYRIVAQWRSPRDDKTYRFQSDPLWTDPTRALAGRRHLPVRLDPDRPRRYWMDIGFLTGAA